MCLLALLHDCASTLLEMALKPGVGEARAVYLGLSLISLVSGNLRSVVVHLAPHHRPLLDQVLSLQQHLCIVCLVAVLDFEPLSAQQG